MARALVAGPWMAWLAIVVMAVGGCSLTPSIGVQIDAIAAAGDRSAGKRYTLVPATDGTVAKDLWFQEFAGYVHQTLAGLGYQAAEAGSAPDQVIALAYGVGEPLEKVYSVPVRDWARWQARAPYPYGSVPTFRTDVDSYTTYASFVALTARVPRDGGQGDELWQAVATSRSASDDLRRLFPVLLTALTPYIGRDTGGQVAVSLREDDPAVAALRGSADDRTR
jgi:hypothetical protein